MIDKIAPHTLKAISHHLWYEISTLEGLLPICSKEQVIINALVEAKVVHIRNLIEFFYPSVHRRTDDIFASDFFDSTEYWDTVRPKITDNLTKARNRAHKEISHLTLKRLEVTPEEKSWPFDAITSDLNVIINVFENKVNREFLSDDWH